MQTFNGSPVRIQISFLACLLSAPLLGANCFGPLPDDLSLIYSKNLVAAIMDLGHGDGPAEGKVSGPEGTVSFIYLPKTKQVRIDFQGAAVFAAVSGEEDKAHWRHGAWERILAQHLGDPQNELQYFSRVLQAGKNPEEVMARELALGLKRNIQAKGGTGPGGGLSLQKGGCLVSAFWLRQKGLAVFEVYPSIEAPGPGIAPLGKDEHTVLLYDFKNKKIVFFERGDWEGRIFSRIYKSDKDK